MLYLVDKQIYKLKLPKILRINSVFHILLLEKNIMKKREANDKQLDFEFETGNIKEYKIDSIWDSAVYIKKLIRQLLGHYYLVLWKNYFEEENIWESILAIW